MNYPYLLLPIGIISIFLYLLSQVFVWLGIIHESFHRKIWNVILFVVFLSTAVLGLLLAIQVNYKFEWTFVKAALKWHVDFGIGLCFVAVFHLVWHWRYYLNLFRSSKNDFVQAKDNENKLSLGINALRHLILLSGFISIAVQVLLIRQITTVFEGNELMMCWTLGAWMMITGIGVFLGRYRKNIINEGRLLSNILFIIGVLPIVAVIAITLLKYQLFPIGVAISPLNFLTVVLIVLFPICLLIGYSFSLLVQLLNNKPNDFIKVYALESIGSLFGGIVVSFIFIQWLTILQSLFVILLFVAISLYATIKSKTYLVLSAFILVLSIITIILPVENELKSFLFPNQNVLESRETYYGNLTVTENSGQFNFYSNGSLLFTTDNLILNEEYVHYAMLQRQKAESVLVISGGGSGMLKEILKYHAVKWVDYLELNPQLVNISSKYAPLPVDSRLHYIKMDGRRFIQTTNKMYDAVIFAIPEPSSLQINRFYTDEFLKILKGKLTGNAVILYGLPPVGNYLSPIKANIEASVYQTLKKNFQNVEIIPGEKDYLLASDSPINHNISEIVGESGISNSYVNQHYIDDFSITQRGAFIKKSIEEIVSINTDSKPIPVFYETLKYSSQFKGSNWLLIILPILLLIPILFLSSVSTGMYISGFSAAATQLLIIFSFQIICGYIYSAIGVIIAIFMGGLAIGSLLGLRFNITRKHFVVSQASLGLYFLLFPLLLLLQKEFTTNIPLFIVFLIMTLIPSVIVGFQFFAGTKLLSGDSVKSAPIVYVVDLIGSALGIIVITVFLLPLLGLVYSCYLIAGLNFIGIVRTLVGRENSIKR